MATASKLEGIHQLDRDTYPPADSDDDDSFVVLDSCCSPNAAMSVEPISTSSIERSLASISDILAKQSLQTMMSTDENKENMVDRSQFVSISGEDIQRSVDNLLVENTRLKDTLAQNNLTMKTQVEKVKTWQDEVLKVQEAHKKKFAEMKKMVQELQTENKKLKTEIETKDSVQQDIKSLENSTIVNKKSDNIMLYELEASKQKIKEMEKALDIIITEKQQLSAEITGYKTEILNYREELQRNQTEKTDKSLWVVTESDISQQIEALRLECKNLKKTNETLDENLKECTLDHGHLQESFERKERELKDVQAHISDLTVQLEKTKEELGVTKENLRQLRAAAVAAHVALNESKESELIDAQARYSDLTVQLEETKEELGVTEENLQQLRVATGAARETINEMKDEIQNWKTVNKNLEDEVSDLRNQYTALKDAYRQKEMALACSEFDVQKLTKEKNEAAQKLTDSEEQIARARDLRVNDLKEKNETIDILKKRVTGMQVVDDELTALRTQLDIYKRDYETERTLRNEIMTEKNRMADELQLLQRRNEQLIEEVDQHRSGFVPVRTEEANTAGSPEHTYTCPKCFFRFSNFEALQNHVYRCIELDSLP